MPARNIVKTYFANGFYHVYNRGVEKREIFLEERDYVVFLGLLKKYLTATPPLENPTEITPLVPKDLHDEIELLAYCLMPNHFHLLLQQKKRDSMTKFVQRLGTSYSIYFNKKHERIGTLFQGTYKAAVVDNENYLLHLSRYIHLNPHASSEGETFKRFHLKNLREYSFSSYPNYLGLRKNEWVKPELILSHFQKTETIKALSLKNFNSYQSFVEEYPADARQEVGALALDS